MTAADLGLAAAFLAIAALYAAVGQAGASGYLAAMGVVGFAPEAMKPTALALNLLVAGIGTALFGRMGLLSWRVFYPFGVLGFPFSFLGGVVHLPVAVYYPVVGVLLLLSAGLILGPGLRAGRPAAPAEPPFVAALLTGAVIGFVSGATGTGGGVFLAPVILAMGWVDIRRTAAVTAAFNLLNSGAALAGSFTILRALPDALPLWLAAAGIGGLAGALLGSRILSERALRRTLAVVLLLSGLKLLLL